jgi:hypothetical protein
VTAAIVRNCDQTLSPPATKVFVSRHLEGFGSTTDPAHLEQLLGPLPVSNGEKAKRHRMEQAFDDLTCGRLRKPQNFIQSVEAVCAFTSKIAASDQNNENKTERAGAINGAAN